MSRLIEILREQGPCGRDALPCEPTLEQPEIWKFHIVGSRAAAPYKMGTLSPVWYLKDEHEKTAVVRAWCRENPRAIENAPKTAVIQRLGRQGKSWKPAIRKAVNEVYAGGEDL